MSGTDTRREIELIPEPEAPTRLAVVLQRLLAGLDAIGVDREPPGPSSRRRRSTPSPRSGSRAACPTGRGRRAHDEPGGRRSGIRSRTSRRALEDLTAHRLVLRASKATAKPTPGRSPSGPPKGSQRPFPKSRGGRGLFFSSPYRRRLFGKGPRRRSMTPPKVRPPIPAIALPEPEAAASLGLGATFFREHVAPDLAVIRAPGKAALPGGRARAVGRAQSRPNRDRGHRKMSGMTAMPPLSVLLRRRRRRAARLHRPTPCGAGSRRASSPPPDRAARPAR